MRPATDSAGTLLAAWRTSSRVTAYLVEHLTPALWNARLPEAPQRTVRMIAGHLHNARCMWLKSLGREHGIAIPASVDRRTVEREELLAALVRSSAGIEAPSAGDDRCERPGASVEGLRVAQPASGRSPCPDVLRRT